MGRRRNENIWASMNTHNCAIFKDFWRWRCYLIGCGVETDSQNCPLRANLKPAI